MDPLFEFVIWKFVIWFYLLLAAAGCWRWWNGTYHRRYDPRTEPATPALLYTTAAAACGLTQIQRGGRPNRRTLTGRSGAFRVRLEQNVGPTSSRFVSTAEGDRRGFSTRLVVDHAEGKLVPVTLRRERRGFLERDLSAREIEIGDKAFDDDFHVTGPHTFVRALLDGQTRRLLRALLLEVDLEVAGGTLCGVLPMTTTWELHEPVVARMLSLMLDAARRLERPPDLVQRLADNAHLDPLPEVRLQNLLTLVREYPERPATEEALTAACADVSDWIRVRAATALGERGRPTLLEVVGRDDLDDDAAAQAIGVLGHHLARERTVELLGRALRGRQMQTARACLAGLGGDGNADAIGVLSRVLGIEEGGLAVAAADALGATGSPAAEPPLIAALARDIPEVRVAAARALGRVGSAGAVLPLKEAEARHAGIEAFRRAARQAIAEIQSRLGGASPGQLSLAAAEAGTLSLVDDERGRLSLKPPEER
jgi:HEAT repeat protein